MSSATLQPGAVEQTALRTRDRKVYANPDGSTTLVCGRRLHYNNGGVWTDVNTTLVGSGKNWSVNASDVLVSLSNRTLQFSDRATGKGISYTLPTNLTVSGNTISFVFNAITWTYTIGPQGAKLTASIPASIGNKSFAWNYGTIGGAQGLALQPDGSLASDAFGVLPPTVEGADGVFYSVATWGLTATQLTLSVNDTALPAAAYPYTLDPSTTFDITTSADDGHWDSGTTFLASTNIAWGNVSSKSNNAWFRYQNVTIPRGATISAAILTHVCPSSQSVNTVKANIYAEAADNPAAPTSQADANSRTMTTAVVAWNNEPAITTGQVYSTPDFTSCVQEVVNRTGWASGNAMQFYLKDNGSTTSGARRNATDFSTSAANASTFSVTYSVPTPTVSAPPVGAFIA